LRFTTTRSTPSPTVLTHYGSATWVGSQNASMRFTGWSHRWIPQRSRKVPRH